MKLPFDSDLEWDLISIIKNNKSLAFDILEKLNSKMFLDKKSSSCFSVLLDMNNLGMPLETASIVRFIKESEVYPETLIEPFLSLPYASIVNYVSDCERLKSLWLRREVMGLSEKALYESQQENKNISSIISEFTKSLNGLYSREGKINTSLSDISLEATEAIYAREANSIKGTHSKYRDNNFYMNGYQGGNLYIIGARPSMGKSLHMVNESKYMADNNIDNLVLSLEMSPNSIAERFISLGTQIENDNLKTNSLSQIDKMQISTHNLSQSLSRVTIEDAGGKNISEVINIIRYHTNRLKQEGRDLKVVFIDYLQLIQIAGSNITSEIGAITRALKILSKSLDIAIVVYSQLSRKVEERPNKVPNLSDLRDSGEIEQDADVVQFLYRPEYYGINVDDNGNSTSGLMEIYTKKQRDGCLFKVETTMIPSLNTIINR